jgi:hypothetical protein
MDKTTALGAETNREELYTNKMIFIDVSSGQGMA